MSTTLAKPGGKYFQVPDRFLVLQSNHLISAATAIAVAQIFPTASRKFSPRGTIRSPTITKTALKPLALFVLPKVKRRCEDSQCWT
jgi:hypothetical protein